MTGEIVYATVIVHGGVRPTEDPGRILSMYVAVEDGRTLHLGRLDFLRSQLRQDWWLFGASPRGWCMVDAIVRAGLAENLPIEPGTYGHVTTVVTDELAAILGYPARDAGQSPS